MHQQLDAIWIGADLDSKKAQVALCAVTGNGQRIALEKFKTRSYPLSLKGCEQLLTEVRKFLNTHYPDPSPHLRVVVESTGIYSLQFCGWICESDPSVRPAVINPKQIKSFMESFVASYSKNDFNDARAIAHFGAERQPEPAPSLDSHTLALRELMRQRQSLVETLTVEQNQASRGYTTPLAKRISAGHQKFLAKAIKQLEEQARKLVRANQRMAADAERMQQMPGIGELTALTLLGEPGDLRRFEDANQIAAYSGLACKQHRSGQRTGRTTISKAGPPQIRRAIYMASLRAITDDQRFSVPYERLISRGKHPRAARCAIMRKMLCTLRSMITHQTNYTSTHRSVNNHSLQGEITV